MEKVNKALVRRMTKRSTLGDSTAVRVIKQHDSYYAFDRFGEQINVYPVKYIQSLVSKGELRNKGCSMKSC